MTIKIIIFITLITIWIIFLTIFGIFSILTNKNVKYNLEKKLEILNSDLDPLKLKIESSYNLNIDEWCFFEQKNYPIKYIICKQKKQLFEKYYNFLDKYPNNKIKNVIDLLSNILITNKYIIFNINHKIFRLNLDSNLEYVFNIKNNVNNIIIKFNELEYICFEIESLKCSLFKKIIDQEKK